MLCPVPQRAGPAWVPCWEASSRAFRTSSESSTASSLRCGLCRRALTAPAPLICRTGQRLTSDGPTLSNSSKPWRLTSLLSSAPRRKPSLEPKPKQLPLRPRNPRSPSPSPLRPPRQSPRPAPHPSSPPTSSKRGSCPSSTNRERTRKSTQS
jgi:hypothetical protein